MRVIGVQICEVSFGWSCKYVREVDEMEFLFQRYYEVHQGFLISAMKNYR